jgi:plastocyanin
MLPACGSDSTAVNPPGGGSSLPSSITIVLGAKFKGTAAFTPNPLTVALADGGVVRWLNNDQTLDSSNRGSHKIAPDDGSFTPVLLPPGGTFQVTYSAAGTYRYHCVMHPIMKGTVIVTR